VALWPGDVEYVRELVYSLWEFADGSLRMVRWTEPFTITFEGELAEDEAVHQKGLEVAAELTRCTGMPISVGPGGACRVKLDRTLRDLDVVATASLSAQGTSLVGATLRFSYRDEILGNRHAWYRNTLLHELGHAVGLGHSPKVKDVMTPGRGPGTFLPHFHEREATALHMMYFHREPGNLPPDRDPKLEAAVAGAPLVRVVSDCRPAF
jgi:hypothetical protein